MIKQLVQLLCFFMKMQEVKKKDYQLDLGYRLDYFESYYKKIGCNIVAVAYRGYDASSGTPN